MSSPRWLKSPISSEKTGIMGDQDQKDDCETNFHIVVASDFVKPVCGHFAGLGSTATRPLSHSTVFQEDVGAMGFGLMFLPGSPRNLFIQTKGRYSRVNLASS